MSLSRSARRSTEKIRRFCFCSTVNLLWYMVRNCKTETEIETEYDYSHIHHGLIMLQETKKLQILRIQKQKPYSPADSTNRVNVHITMWLHNKEVCCLKPISRKNKTLLESGESHRREQRPNNKISSVRVAHHVDHWPYPASVKFAAWEYFYAVIVTNSVLSIGKTWLFIMVPR